MFKGTEENKKTEKKLTLCYLPESVGIAGCAWYSRGHCNRWAQGPAREIWVTYLDLENFGRMKILGFFNLSECIKMF